MEAMVANVVNVELWTPILASHQYAAMLNLLWTSHLHVIQCQAFTFLAARNVVCSMLVVAFEINLMGIMGTFAEVQKHLLCTITLPVKMVMKLQV